MYRLSRTPSTSPLFFSAIDFPEGCFGVAFRSGFPVRALCEDFRSGIELKLTAMYDEGTALLCLACLSLRTRFTRVEWHFNPGSFVSEEHTCPFLTEGGIIQQFFYLA